MKAAGSCSSTMALTGLCLGIVVLFGCSREPKPGEWTGGYDCHVQAGNLQVRYACKTWHAKEDTVSYALFCQAETAGFSFDGHSFGFVLAGPEAQQLQIPYVSGRQYWIKPDGSYEVIERPWSAGELRLVSQLFEEQPGIQFDSPDALRVHVEQLLSRRSQPEPHSPNRE